MAAFGTNMKWGLPEEGALKGKRRAVACDCWFTSTGKTFPRFIKLEDEEGVIHTLTELEVLYTEDKRYCGIPAKVYACRTVQEGIEYRFRLLFYQEECKWFLMSG